MQSLPRHPQKTLSTSYLEERQTPSPNAKHNEWVVDAGAPPGGQQYAPSWAIELANQPATSIRTTGLNSTGKGVLIGMLSAFGLAGLIVLIVAIIYFFRYTSRGKIFLDRIGRPGEYDDEQAFLQEEERALEEMDDLQRTEYLRAKGASLTISSLCCMSPTLQIVDYEMQHS